MAIGSIAAYGVRSSDVAGIYHSATFYRCYVYEDTESNNIRVTIFTEQDQGQDVVIHAGVSIVGTVAAGAIFSNPKIVANGSKFIVYFIQTLAGVATLYSSRLDLATLSSGWSTQTSSVAIHTDLLYDVNDMGPSTTDYCLAYKTTTPDITIQRRTSDLLASWSVTQAETPTRVLGVFGRADHGYVVASYEQAVNLLMRSTRRNASDGLGAATAFTFPSNGLDDWIFRQVGHAAIGSSTVAVLVEARVNTATDRDIFVAGRKIDATTMARNDTEQITHHVQLCARPWVYNSQLYACIGFDTKTASVGTPANAQDVQHYFYIANFDHGDWSGVNVRARPVANINHGNAIVNRPLNQISHSSGHNVTGPDIKTKTFAVEIGTRLRKQDGRLLLGNQLCVGYRAYMEDPWLMHRDESDPADPDSFSTAFGRSQFGNLGVGRLMFVDGGTPSLYDGVQVVENGYHWFPEITAIAESNTAPGALTLLGVYTYVCVYEWFDARGHLHESSPSVPVSMTLTGVNDTITVSVLPLNLTMKHGTNLPGARGRVAVYRTTANGDGLFYRDSSATTPEIINDPDDNGVYTFASTQSDTLIQKQEILSRTLLSGAWTPLEPIQPPALHGCCLWQGSVFAIDSEDDRTIWYSSPAEPDAGSVQYRPPEWNPANVYRADDSDGLVALCPMDLNLVAFGRNHVFVIQGVPNDLTGSGSTLQHQIVARNIGCMSTRSVCSTPMGVVFQSEKGIYLITRGLTLEYIGADVEDTLRLLGALKDAVHMEDRHQVRWIGEQLRFADELTDGTSVGIMYDYLTQRWSRHEMPTGAVASIERRPTAGAVWRGYAAGDPYVFADDALSLYVEKFLGFGSLGSEYSDELAATFRIPLTITTTWIHVAGINGFQRVWSALVNTERMSASQMRARVGYDTDGTYPDTFTDSFTWASPAPSAMRIRPSKQRMAAIRIEISDTNATPSTTEHYKITSIAFEIAVAPGKHREVSDSSVGA